MRSYEYPIFKGEVLSLRFWSPTVKTSGYTWYTFPWQFLLPLQPPRVNFPSIIKVLCSYRLSLVFKLPLMVLLTVSPLERTQCPLKSHHRSCLLPPSPLSYRHIYEMIHKRMFSLISSYFDDWTLARIQCVWVVVSRRRNFRFPRSIYVEDWFRCLFVLFPWSSYFFLYFHCLLFTVQVYDCIVNGIYTYQIYMVKFPNLTTLLYCLFTVLFWFFVLCR